jgi:predicted TIM-barrel fold metal-dependent hydrolase
MKIIALEEHLVTPSLLDAWRAGPNEIDDQAAAGNSRGPFGARLLDLGAGRLAEMDNQGVDTQVLSITQPGVQNLGAAQAVPIAREANDLIAATVAARPDRFEGFATLPTPDPAAAAAELYRAVGELGLVGAMVFGRTGDKNADHPDYEPLWAAASALRAPIYIHPQRPQRAVKDVYYSGFGDQHDSMLSSGLIGWHYETGMQLLRMILGGVFDRNPGLQVIVGHWGELVLFWESRFTMLQKRGHIPGKLIIDYFREHVSFTGSGDTSDRSLAWTKELVGANRILYATDYPFVDNSGGVARSFLTNADLTAQEREAIGHGNWERLTAHLH